MNQDKIYFSADVPNRTPTRQPEKDYAGTHNADKENVVLPTLRYSMAPAMEQASAAQMTASSVIVLKKDEEEDGSSAFIAISKKL